ncbi:MAG: DUF222 domain-containing protein [Actinomycetota bacterium]
MAAALRGADAIGEIEALLAEGPVTELVRELRDVAEAVFTAADGSHDHTDLAGAVVQVGTIAAAVDAALGAIIDASERTMVVLRHGGGARKLDQFMLANGNNAGVEVRARIRRSKWLRDFRELAEAHADGILSVEHLERIRKGLDNPRTHFLLRRDQRFFVETAMTCDFVDFERACDYWKIAADPDGAEPQEQLASTSVTATRRSDGMVKVDGLLDPLSGQVFLTAWEKHKQQLAVNDDETGIRRSEGQRGAVALLSLVAKGAAREDGSQPDPLINIVMSQAVAEDTMRRLAEHDVSPLPVDPHDADGRCEFIDGTPVHPHLVMWVLGLAALQRTVMTAKGRPLETSHATRNFPKWLKHLGLIRSRGRCEDDGCDAPFPWLQADHQHPHSKAGPNNWANLTIRCRPHNLAKGNQA